MTNRDELSERAEHNRQTAMRIVSDSRIVEIWEGAGATVNMVGSAKSGLLIDRDIDFHVYTDEPVLEKSFSAMMEFGKNPRVKELQYRNSLDTEEVCVEWHILYEHTDGEIWKIDIIHILSGSTFDGVIERATDAVIDKLTPERKEAILRIKYDMPADKKAMGIEVYYAVYALGIQDYAGFEAWKSSCPSIDFLSWIPE